MLHVLAISNSADNQNIEGHVKNLKLSFMPNVYKVNDRGAEGKIIFSKISEEKPYPSLTVGIFKENKRTQLQSDHEI